MQCVVIFHLFVFFVLGCGRSRFVFRYRFVERIERNTEMGMESGRKDVAIRFGRTIVLRNVVGELNQNELLYFLFCFTNALFVFVFVFRVSQNRGRFIFTLSLMTLSEIN